MTVTDNVLAPLVARKTSFDRSVRARERIAATADTVIHIIDGRPQTPEPNER